MKSYIHIYIIYENRTIYIRYICYIYDIKAENIGNLRRRECWENRGYEAEEEYE